MVGQGGHGHVNNMDNADVIKVKNKGSRSTFEFTSRARVNLSQFVLYPPDFGLIKQTLNRTSRCNKVDAVRLYASYRCSRGFTFTKGAELREKDILIC